LYPGPSYTPIQHIKAQRFWLSVYTPSSMERYLSPFTCEE